jgi:hypothetical protein
MWQAVLSIEINLVNDNYIKGRTHIELRRIFGQKGGSYRRVEKIAL